MHSAEVAQSETHTLHYTYISLANTKWPYDYTFKQYISQIVTLQINPKKTDKPTSQETTIQE